MLFCWLINRLVNKIGCLMCIYIMVYMPRRALHERHACNECRTRLMRCKCTFYSQISSCLYSKKILCLTNFNLIRQNCIGSKAQKCVSKVWNWYVKACRWGTIRDIVPVMVEDDKLLWCAGVWTLCGSCLVYNM